MGILYFILYLGVYFNRNRRGGAFRTFRGVHLR